MSTDIFASRDGVIVDEKSAKARRAVKAFRAMQPTLTSYARIITGNPQMRVEMSTTSNGMTDGKKIYFRPPIALGDNTPHVRKLCDKRDENLQLLCKACAVRESIYVVIYHEIGHNSEGSFDASTDQEKAELIERAIKEAGGKYAEAIAKKIRTIPDWRKDSYITMAGIVSPFLPGLVNALEDARVNRAVHKARKGTKVMFDADAYRVFHTGVEQVKEGEVVTLMWSDYPLNMQAAVGLYCKASGYDYTDWFVKEVVEALNDSQLTSLVRQIDTVRSVGGVYELTFPILARFRELGFFKSENDPEEEKQDDQAEEETQSDQSDGQEDEGAESDSNGPPSSEAGDEADSGGADGDSSDDADGGSGEGESGSGEADGESSGSGSSDPNVNDDSEDSEERDGDDTGSDSSQEGSTDSGDADGSDDAESESSDDSSGESDLDEDGTERNGSSTNSEGMIEDDADSEESQESDGSSGDGADGDASSDDAGVSDEGKGSDSSGGSAGDDEAPLEDRGGQGEGGSDEASEDSSSEADSNASQSESSSGGTDRVDDEESTEGENSSAQEPRSSDQNSGEDADRGRDDQDTDAESVEDSPTTSPDDADLTGNDGEDLGSDDSLEQSDGSEQGSDQNSLGSELRLDGSDLDGTDSDDSGVERTEPKPELRERDARDESPEEEAIDTGADEGLGGVEVIEDSAFDRLPLGSPEEVEGAIHEFAHPEDRPLNVQEEKDSSKEIDRAIIQGLYFETPSRKIFGVREHYYGQPVLAGKHNEYNMSQGWDHSSYAAWGLGRKALGIEGDFHADESILGPALLRMRVAFADNQRGKDIRNVKSGKVDGRVLGRRAHHGDERLFRRRIIPGKKDYFVLIGVDISGSTIGENIVLAKRAAMAQATLCHRMGIKFAVYAHSGNYHEPDGGRASGFDLDMYHIKDADEPWSDSVQERLLKIGPDSANLDGHTMEYYRKVLDTRTETHKVMLYYTDGKMPAENHDEELDILQREIRICRRKKYVLIGVGIRTDSPVRHGLDTVQVDDDDDLVKVVKHLEKRLLAI